MKVWRIESQKRLATAATGEGSKLVGARWNSPGLPVVYTSEHLSLALLEILVHATNPDTRGVARARASITVPDSGIEEVPLPTIPRDFGPLTPLTITQAIGDAWLRTARSVALLVPSAIVPSERNLLLNPLHPDFRRCVWGKFEPIHLDGRLWTVR